MTDSSKSSDSCLLAILSLAKDADIKCLTKTELVKYLYLLDVYVAEETEGSKWTDIDWQFLHFGPFAPEVASSIDSLVSKSFIKEQAIQNATRDGYLYSLSDWKGVSVDGLGIPRGAVIKLKQSIRDYDKNLPKLLNYVYFKTEPMSVARPGEVLDFSMCRKFDLTAVKPIPMKVINKEKIAALRQKRAVAIARKQEKLSKIVWSGDYDEAYFQAMSDSVEPPVENGLRGTASIAV